MNKNKAIESDPEIFSRIASLNILATKLVEGLLSGNHRSRHTGSSVEFSDYKDYTPGDEIKHIDWKVVGKTDKHQIKQFEQSTNLKATILLDASGSMGYESSNPRDYEQNGLRANTGRCTFLPVFETIRRGGPLFI